MPGGVDHQVGADLVFATGGVVADLDPRDGLAGGGHGHDLREGPDVRPVVPGRGEEAEWDAHRVHGRVRHLNREPQVRVETGLQTQRCVALEPLGGDRALPAGFEETRRELGVLVGQSNEQAAILLERAGRDAPQDLVLDDALDGRRTVRGGVSGTAVEQPVVPTGGTGCDFAPLDESHA